MPVPEGCVLTDDHTTPAACAQRPRTLLAMGAAIHAQLLAEGALDRLARVAAVETGRFVSDFGDADPAALADTEVLFTHWGAPRLTAHALRAMPRLRAVIHAAGSVKHHVTEAVWERGIAVSTAAGANALPVAEFTLATILFSGKRILDSARVYRDARDAVPLLPYFAGHGNHRRTVGIVGASRVGRRVLDLMRPFDFEVLLYDPYVEADEAERLGARSVGLDELVRHSSVVSIHAPQLPETRHMFDRRRLGLLRDGATLINTARGSLVDTDALTEELLVGRIHAVLDVTEPEVLPPGSPLYTLPNVLLTPHIAGSLGNELVRMAHWATDEVQRYAEGRPLAHGVGPDELARSA